jgi:hypothetical protein
MAEKFEKKEKIIFRCAVEKVPFTPVGGGVRMYYGPRENERGDDLLGDSILLTRGDFEKEMSEGKNALTGRPKSGRPKSGLFNHFTLSEAPDDIGQMYNDFMERDVTIDEVAKMAPQNIRLLAERCRIDGHDTEKIDKLVTDLAKHMGLDMKTVDKGMSLEEENKLRQKARKAGINNWHNMKIENIKKKLEELEQQEA